MFERIVSVLTDEELEKLSGALYSEQNTRAEKKFDNNEFPELNAEEIQLVKEGLRINAIKAYRDRTKLNLRLAKMVVDNVFDELINQGHRKLNPT